MASLPVVRLQVAAANQINGINNFSPSSCGCLRILTVLCFQEFGSFQSHSQLSLPCGWCTSWLAVLDFRDTKCTRPESRSCAGGGGVVCASAGCTWGCAPPSAPPSHPESRLWPCFEGRSVGNGMLRGWVPSPPCAPGAPPATSRGLQRCYGTLTWGHGRPPAGGERLSPTGVCPCCQLGGGFRGAVRQEGLPWPRERALSRLSLKTPPLKKNKTLTVSSVRNKSLPQHRCSPA